MKADDASDPEYISKRLYLEERDMKGNVGTIDRIIRVVLGLVLIGLGVFVRGGAFWWLAVIGAVSLVTGAVGFCGLYTLFGISTCSRRGSTHS